MKATVDSRHWPATVSVQMSLPEFVETVQWLERTSPHDPATAHWRRELNRVRRKRNGEHYAGFPTEDAA